MPGWVGLATRLTAAGPQDEGGGCQGLVAAMHMAHVTEMPGSGHFRHFPPVEKLAVWSGRESRNESPARLPGLYKPTHLPMHQVH